MMKSYSFSPSARWVAGACLLGVAASASANGPVLADADLERRIERMEQELQLLREALRQQKMATDEAKQQAQEAQEMVADTEVKVLPDKDVRLEISGRVNQALLYADNDTDDKVFIVDNDNSASRIGFLGEADFGDWTTGAEFVIGIEVNSTDEIKFSDTDQESEQFGDGDIGDVRQAHWFIEHPGFGLFSIGQGDEAGEDASEADLSGTTLIAQSDVDDTAGGLEYPLLPDSDDDEIDDFFSNLDADRSTRILYETPGFGGLALRASATQSDELEPGVALVYGAEMNGFEVEAAAAWRAPDGGDEDEGDVFHGSVSVMSPVGVNLTLAGGVFELDDSSTEDPDFYYVKLGYQTQQLVSLGSTSFSVDFFQGHNNDTFASPDGDLPEATSIGGGVVQKIDELSTEIYLGLRNYEVEDLFIDGEPIDDPDDLFTVLAGARVRF